LLAALLRPICRCPLSLPDIRWRLSCWRDRRGRRPGRQWLRVSAPHRIGATGAASSGVPIPDHTVLTSALACVYRRFYRVVGPMARLPVDKEACMRGYLVKKRDRYYAVSTRARIRSPGRSVAAGQLRHPLRSTRHSIPRSPAHPRHAAAQARRPIEGRQRPRNGGPRLSATNRGQCRPGTEAASRNCQPTTGATVSIMNRVRTPHAGGRSGWKIR
jgi:hypothetical protein